MAKHTIENKGAQHLDMYGVRVCLQQVQCYEIEVSFMGGTWPDGAEKRKFPNMAEALVAVADIAQTLEEEEGDDWGVDENEDAPRDLYAVNAPLGPRTGY